MNDNAGSSRAGSVPQLPDAPFTDVAIDAEWLDFGADDPLDADRWINACLHCRQVPTLAFNGKGYQVCCVCGAEGAPSGVAAIAAVNWNKSPRSAHPSYRDLPFFGLATLSPASAHSKLATIRAYLEEQKRRCEWRTRHRIGTGHRYHQRIRVYLVWSIYAQGLVKEALATPGGTTDAALSPAIGVAARLKRWLQNP